MRVTQLGAWDNNSPFSVFVAPGDTDGQRPPILGWNTPNALELIQLRADGNGVEHIPVARLLTLRGARRLRGLAATRAGITIAADGAPEEAGPRVYTIAAVRGDPTITEGERLPELSPGDNVSTAPAPSAADSGAVVLTYNTQGGLAAAMQYTP